MKYSFDEKKKAVGAVAALIFVCAAGVIWLLSGNIQPGEQGTVNGTERFVSAVRDDWDDGGSAGLMTDGNDEGNPSDAGDNADVRAVTVHVCGAVRNPGVYELAALSRVGDAVDAAGGFKDNAAKDYLNLAENISDGQKITVYTKKQVKSFSGKGPDGSDSGSVIHSDGALQGLVNINTASREELMTLQGIGESKADDIIAYRESNGRFKNKDELMNIPGIKKGVYSKISDNITV